MKLSRIFHWRERAVAWDHLGSGPPVVMCHGTPWSSRLWSSFATALSRHFSVYLWDMPGYGQSSKHPEHAVDLGVQAELLADLLGYWELPAPHVIAHDIGGAVSLRAHLLLGAEYSSLALVDVVALRPWGSEYFRLIGQHADVFAAQPNLVHEGALRAYISGASYRGLTTEQLAGLTEPWLSSEGQRAFYQQIAEADQRFTDEVQDRYQELALPVKIIWGAEDQWVPVDRAHRLGEMIPGSEVEIIDGAGHLIQYDAPVQLAVSLRDWLPG